MSNILILGDAHLGGSLNHGKQSVGSAINSRILDQLKLLDWTYEQAVNNNVSHIILTGDVFDEPKPHYNLVALFLDWLQKCTEYDISVHIIAGNHDILRSGQFTTSVLDVVTSADIPKTYVYKKINTLHLENVGITFFPFRDRRSFNTNSNSEAIELLQKQLQFEVNAISKNSMKILVGHLAVEGSIPVGYELDELANELFCPIDMFVEYDAVWMGHVHKFQILSRSPYVAHIGSMDISDFGEAEHSKYIVIVEPSSKDKFRYVKIPTRSLKHLTIQIPQNEFNINKFIEEEIKNVDLNNSIVKLTISLPSNANCVLDRKNIENAFYAAGAFHVARISEERKFTSLKKQINEKIDNSINEIAAIKMYSTLVEENIRENFVSLASEMIQEYKENLK